MTMPKMSQVQEKMSSSARAQRRALMEPMPSQISATARPPYMARPGRSMAVLGGGAFGALAAIVCPNSIRGINNAHRPPSSRVKMPKMIRPVERFL